MRNYDTPEKYACLHVITGMLATLIVWILLGVGSWMIVNPETFYGGFVWILLWIGADVIATHFIWTFIPYFYYRYFKSKSDESNEIS